MYDFATICLVVLAAAVSTCCADPIHCRRKSKYCYEDSSIERFSKSPQDPAPLPESLKLQASGGIIHMEWRQRKSQLQDVKAYSIEVSITSLGEPLDYTLAINSSLIIETLQDDDTTVYFTFDDVPLLDPVSMVIVTLYALPLYNLNDTDYYREAVLDPQNRNFPFQPPQLPAIPKQLPNIPTSPFPFPTTSYQPCTPCRKARTLPPGSTQAHEECENRVVMALVLLTTNMATASLMLLCVMARTRYRRIKRRKSDSGSLTLLKDGTQKGNVSAKQSRSILVLTNSEEGGDDGSNRDYFKRIALCVANTLKSSGEFDVSCNLWMTENISEIGVAVWAHDVMKTNNKVIILCNSDESEKSNQSAYTQLIQNLVKSTYFDKSKFLIICTEERSSHKCFTKMDVQALEICRHFKIKRNLNDLVKALRPDGLERCKVDRMNQVFAQMMAKMHVHQSNHGHRQDFKLNSPFYEVIYENESICEQLLSDEKSAYLKHKEPYKKRRREFSESSTSEGKPETQYDSLYSSRCNSQSSETVSSGEDTGYFDHPNGQKCFRSRTHQKSTGTRSKKKAIIEAECP